MSVSIAKVNPFHINLFNMVQKLISCKKIQLSPRFESWTFQLSNRCDDHHTTATLLHSFIVCLSVWRLICSISVYFCINIVLFTSVLLSACICFHLFYVFYLIGFLCVCLSICLSGCLLVCISICLTGWEQLIFIFLPVSQEFIVSSILKTSQLVRCFNQKILQKISLEPNTHSRKFSELFDIFIIFCLFLCLHHVIWRKGVQFGHFGFRYSWIFNDQVFHFLNFHLLVFLQILQLKFSKELFQNNLSNE